MSRLILLVVLGITLSRADKEDGNRHYLITSPYIYHADQNETVTVDLFGSNKSCEVVLNLKKDRSYYASAKGIVEPGKKATFPLMVTSSALQKLFRWDRYFQLEAKICGSTTKSKTVRVMPGNAKKNIIFIQTDKPVYKPGQKIRMRIISLDADLRPKGQKVENVYVSTSSTRIKQWSNVSMEDGIASLELLLSKEPVLGEYTITAIIGKNEKTQKISVEKYVLPKFNVDITPPSYLALDQKEFDTKICAKYTYGKNVKGNMNVHLCLEHGFSRRKVKKCQNITKEIDGCTNIIIPRDDFDVANIEYLWSAVFTVKAKVTETLTGVTLKNEAKIRQMKPRSFSLSFDGTSNKFKPGLPFKYVLKVTQPDLKPVTGASSRVLVRVSVTRGYRGTLLYRRKFVVENGFVSDSIDDETFNSQTLHFKAELLNKNPYPTRARYNYDVIARKSVYPWYSPSFSYLEILKTQNTAFKIGERTPLKVRYTIRNDTGNEINFHYTMRCKGEAVLSGIHRETNDHVLESEEIVTKIPVAPTKGAREKGLPTKGAKEKRLPTKGAREKGLPTKGAPTEDIGLKFREIIPDIGSPGREPKPVETLKTKPLVETFSLNFSVTMEMMPSCRIMVYYVRKDKELVADTLEFDVEDRLENQVSMRFQDNEKKPGEKTNLILKASPESRVAIVAVDKSVHLMADGNELSKKKIRPFLRTDREYAPRDSGNCPYGGWGRGKRMAIYPYWGDVSSYDDASVAFSDAGLIFLSNLDVVTKPCQQQWEWLVGERGPQIVEGPVAVALSGRPGSKRPNNQNKQKTIKTRKEFPETWLWSEEKLGKSGEKTLQVTIPDTITTWVANGFAMSKTAGLGISSTATIKAFQPFFVQITLPYSVIRGEEIPVTVTAFNYLPECAGIKLRLNHKSLDYKVTSYHIHKLCVCGDAGQSVKFKIIPSKLGHIPLTVTATTSSSKLCPTASSLSVQDAVTRKLLVEPEGIRKQISHGGFFCPKGQEYSEAFDLEVPKDIVAGSLYPTVTIIGDIMGAALANLDDLLRMPYGCGEQNMANFAPNIYVMEYLTKTAQVTESIRSKALNFMEIGYQRELTYKRKSGSYSAFGNSDAQGSMMLTAFVVRSFARAKKFIFVDEKQVEHSVNWFASKQKKNGCFPQHGKLFHRGLQGGVDSEVTLTAYVTTALLEAGWSTNSTIVSDALSCIESQLHSVNDSYATALVTYTLTLAKHKDAQNMLKLLRSKAIKQGDLMHWSKKSEHGDSRNSYYKSSADIEMTAYALLAILHQGDEQSLLNDDVMDIVRWLSKQRNPRGGFSSTQDTCVALQALATFAGKAYGSGADFKSMQLSGSLKMGNFYRHDFSISKQNKLTLQTVELPDKIIPGKMKVSVKGAGCALIQISLKYNVPEPEEVPAFSVKVDVRKRRSLPDEGNSACSPLKLHITARWLKEDVSNMAVVDIKLVSGFSVIEKSLAKLSRKSELKFKRYDIDGQHIQLYFDEIKDLSFSIDIHQDTLVKKLKPAVVQVYDYYEPESQAKVMYKIGDSECYGNRIDKECPKCMKAAHIDDLIQAKVACNSTVIRTKSTQGLLKVIKAFLNDPMEQKKVYKKKLKYQIPDFCPCEEIYEDERSIVIGQHSYFKDDGKKTTIVLDSGATIIKYTGRSMKPKIKKIKNILRSCKRNGKK